MILRTGGTGKTVWPQAVVAIDAGCGHGYYRIAYTGFCSPFTILPARRSDNRLLGCLRNTRLVPDSIRPLGRLCGWRISREENKGGERNPGTNGAIGAEPGGVLRNRKQGANCLSAASFCPAGFGARRTGLSQRRGCLFFWFFSLGKQRKERPSRRETELHGCYKRLKRRMSCRRYSVQNLVEIKENIVLIRINKLFDPAMTQEQMYEATRGVWRIGSRRNKADFAFAVFKGEVKEVYKIISWHPAGTLKYYSRIINSFLEKNDMGKRWEFDGVVAEEEIRKKYVGQSVKQFFQKGASNPVIYVNCQ